MSHARRLAVACLVVAAVRPSTASPEELARGQVIESVPCARAAGQTYALYLPSAYSPARKWPILYAFDPRARGAIPVRRFRDAAERYGWVVIGSNNSRNGPIAVSDAALHAMMADAESRLAIDPSRTYFTGFSGGARVAVLAGLALSGSAGVIGAGAGFPLGVEPSASVGFSYYGAVGVDDFAYPEMTRLDKTLGKLHVRHRLHVFDGAHEWPPAEVCTRAIEWMEVQAIKTSLRPRDERLLDQIFLAGAAEAAGDEKAGRLHQAYQRYSLLADEAAGLRDAAPYEEKTRQLGQSREVKRRQSDEDRSIDIQGAEQDRLERLAEEAVAGDDDRAALLQLLASVTALTKQAERPASDSHRMAARRVLVTLWAAWNEAVAHDVEAGDFERAATRLDHMARMRPSDARVDYAVARVHARSGKKGAAIQALRSAVAKGFADLAAIEAEPAFDSLRADEVFKSAVSSLR